MPGATPGELTEEGGHYVIPAAEVGGFDSITASASELLSKINRIDFDKIGNSLVGASVGIDQLVNRPQIKATLAALEKAMALCCKRSGTHSSAAHWKVWSSWSMTS